MDNPPVSVDHYENFPVASVLCPPKLRAPITAIYHFARTADDLADEGSASAQERLAELHAYRGELQALAEGTRATRWPLVFKPLGAAVERFQIPLPLLHDLLDAFEQDCHNPCYPSRTALLDYCRRSANPIGRLLLHFYGLDDPQALAESDAICSALQLINFWQDPSVDLARGRNYFSLDDLQSQGLTHADMRHGADSPATQAVIRQLVGWSRELMLRGAPLAFRLPGRAAWELRLVIQGGLLILAKIEAMDCKTLSERPVLRGLDLPGMLWRALRMAPSAAPAKAIA